jgi:hypothetical protein
MIGPGKWREAMQHVVNSGSLLRLSQDGTHLCQHCLTITNIFLFKNNRSPIVHRQVVEIVTCFQHSASGNLNKNI